MPHLSLRLSDKQADVRHQKLHTFRLPDLLQALPAGSYQDRSCRGPDLQAHTAAPVHDYNKPSFPAHLLQYSALHLLP